MRKRGDILECWKIAAEGKEEEEEEDEEEKELVEGREGAGEGEFSEARGHVNLGKM